MRKSKQEFPNVWEATILRHSASEPRSARNRSICAKKQCKHIDNKTQMLQSQTGQIQKRTVNFVVHCKFNSIYSLSGHIPHEGSKIARKHETLWCRLYSRQMEFRSTEPNAYKQTNAHLIPQADQMCVHSMSYIIGSHVLLFHSLSRSLAQCMIFACMHALRSPPPHQHTANNIHAHRSSSVPIELGAYDYVREYYAYICIIHKWNIHIIHTYAQTQSHAHD